MKRFILFLFALAVILIPATASAGGWVTKEIRWQKSSYKDANTIWVRDTTHRVFGGIGGEASVESALDTSGVFTLDDADLPPGGMLSATSTDLASTGWTATGAGVGHRDGASRDTSIYAFILIQTDTSVVTAPTLGSTAPNLVMDGRLGGFGAPTTLSRGWVTVDSLTLTTRSPTAGETLIFPMSTLGPYGSTRSLPNLRVRTVLATDIVGYMPAARIFVRYWDNEK